jgi:hypothetical protein
MEKPLLSKSWQTSTVTPCWLISSTNLRAAVTDMPLVIMMAMS